MTHSAPERSFEIKHSRALGWGLAAQHCPSWRRIFLSLEKGEQKERRMEEEATCNASNVQVCPTHWPRSHSRSRETNWPPEPGPRTPELLFFLLRSWPPVWLLLWDPEGTSFTDGCVLMEALYYAMLSRFSCVRLCDPIDSSPPGFPIPGILQARTLEWVAISFSNAWKWKEKVKSLSHVQLLATTWTAAYQAPPSMGFSRQEYWSGVPLPSPNVSTTDT